LTAAIDPTVRDLTQVLDEIRVLHDELATTLRSKLEAARRADIDALQSCTAREGFLASRIRNRDGLRRQLVDRLAQGIGVTNAPGMPISALTRSLLPAQREGLLAASVALRRSIEAVGGLNRMSAHITAELIKHVRAATRAMTELQTGATGYLETGRPATAPAARVFDAVG
jgi:hypothetical protein